MKKCIKGINDLQTWCIKNNRQDILREWDYPNNNNINPSMVFAHSSTKRIHWKCSKGHTWICTPANRTHSKHNCPYCCNQKVLTGYNDLATTHPSLLLDWDYSKNKFKPTEVIAGTHKRAFWKCHKCRNEWQSEIRSRSRNNIGCPYCHGKRPILGKTDIASVYPEVLADWDYSKNKFKPTEVTYGTGKNIWWKCKRGHSYQMTIYNKVHNKICPQCFAWHRTSFPEQAVLFYVKKVYPDAISHYRDIFSHGMELDIYIPSVKVGIEYDGMAWHTDQHLEREKRKYAVCKKNGVDLIRLMENRERRGLGICNNAFWVAKPHDNYYLTRAIKELLYFIGDAKLEIPFMEQTIPANPFEEPTIEDIIKSLTPKLPNILGDPDIYTDVDVERDKGEIYAMIDKGYASLEEKFPEIAKEWDIKKNGKVTPRMIHYGSNNKFWWKCSTCGKSWKTSVIERTGPDHTGCPDCSYKRGGKLHIQTLIKRNGSLADTHPYLVKEWDFRNNKYKPSELTAGSGYKAFWICKKCGSRWMTTVCHRTSRNSGCPVCLNQKIIPGFNDLAAKRSDLLKDWNYSKNKLNPTTIGPGSGKRAYWKCHICGYEWSAIIVSRHKGAGCPHCFNLKKLRNKYALGKKKKI